MLPEKLCGVSFPFSHWEHVSHGEVYSSTCVWIWFVMELQADKSIQGVVGVIWHARQCGSYLHLSIKMDWLLSRSNMHCNLRAHDRTFDNSSSTCQRTLGASETYWPSNEFIPPFLTLPDPAVTAAREDFRYMPTLVWTEVNQLRCIAICHREKGLVVWLSWDFDLHQIVLEYSWLDPLSQNCATFTAFK